MRCRYICNARAQTVNALQLFSAAQIALQKISATDFIALQKYLLFFFKNRSSLSAASQYKFYSTIIYNKTNNCMKKPIQLLHHDGSYIYNKTHQKHVV